MKFNCGPSPEVKRQIRKRKLEDKAKRLKQWHDWFAWRPVRVNENECSWLETIERKGSFICSYRYGYWWEWTYRPIQPITLEPDQLWPRK